MTDMNLNKLPCVNTIHLNKYLAEQEKEDNFQAAFEEKTKELEQRELTADDFAEALHRVTSRGHDLSMNHITAHVMRWTRDPTDHNAQMVCASIKGMMQSSRFVDSMDKAHKELSK